MHTHEEQNRFTGNFERQEKDIHVHRFVAIARLSPVIGGLTVANRQGCARQRIAPYRAADHHRAMTVSLSRDKSRRFHDFDATPGWLIPRRPLPKWPTFLLVHPYSLPTSAFLSVAKAKAAEERNNPATSIASGIAPRIFRKN